MLFTDDVFWLLTTTISTTYIHFLRNSDDVTDDVVFYKIPIDFRQI